MKYLLVLFISSRSLAHIPAINHPESYIKLLHNKSIAVVANQSSVVGKKHFIDLLIEKQKIGGFKVQKIFALEHGFKGKNDAGDVVRNGKYRGIPVLSLYKKNKKAPNLEDLKNIDIILFDVQDIGVRTFTYISSLGLIMQAISKANKVFLTKKELIVFDRPNPNSDYIGGPTLDVKGYSSFVGLYPIPLVYGLTIAELAKMMKGEKWLSQLENVYLKIVPMKYFDRDIIKELNIKPSPNLPTLLSIRLFPSLVGFEATQISEGRGTETPFSWFGSVYSKFGTYIFTPRSIKGAALKPKHLGKMIYGNDLRMINPSSVKFNYNYLFTAYKRYRESSVSDFFINDEFFDKLMGNNKVRYELLKAKNWSNLDKIDTSHIKKYKKLRIKKRVNGEYKYLLYPDFKSKL